MKTVRCVKFSNESTERESGANPKSLKTSTISPTCINNRLHEVFRLLIEYLAALSTPGDRLGYNTQLIPNGSIHQFTQLVIERIEETPR